MTTSAPPSGAPAESVTRPAIVPWAAAPRTPRRSASEKAMDRGTAPNLRNSRGDVQLLPRPPPPPPPPGRPRSRQPPRRRQQCRRAAPSAIESPEEQPRRQRRESREPLVAAEQDRKGVG